MPRDVYVPATIVTSSSVGRRIVESPVAPVRLAWTCPLCRSGEMISTGERRYSDDRPLVCRWTHECSQCGLTEVSDDGEYPRVEFREVPR